MGVKLTIHLPPPPFRGLQIQFYGKTAKLLARFNLNDTYVVVLSV